LITAAALALAAGDALGALKRVGLREDPPALALRGIAMAQLDDLVRENPRSRKPRACSVRERRWRVRGASSPRPNSRSYRAISAGLRRPLNEAGATLEAHGDRLNAAHARNIEARRLLLIGSLEEAERVLGEVDPGPLPPLLTAARELVIAGIAIRRLQMKRRRAMRFVAPSMPRAREASRR
jgi:hypothetical protein